MLILLYHGILFSQTIYTYPVKPGTEKWSTLDTENERLAAMQIPDSILSGMTTNELVQVCLNYPAFFHFVFFNDLQSGMIAVIVKFNGIRELMQRPDAGEELFKIYSKMDINGYNNNNLQCTEEYWPIRFMFIELTLAQETILYLMPEYLQKQLLEICKGKMNMKYNSEGFNTIFSYQSTALIMSRLLKKLDGVEYDKIINENPNIELFNKTGEIQDTQTLQFIMDYTDLFLNKIKYISHENKILHTNYLWLYFVSFHTL